jgi:hypothetical protein
VHHEVGLAHLFQGGLEALDQVVGQAANEPDGVGEQEAPPLVQGRRGAWWRPRVAKSWSLT